MATYEIEGYSRYLAKHMGKPDPIVVCYIFGQLRRLPVTLAHLEVRFQFIIKMQLEKNIYVTIM